MSRLLFLAALLSLAFAPAPFPRRETAEADLKRMQGEWRLVREGFGGKARPVRIKESYVISGRKMTLKQDGRSRWEGMPYQTTCWEIRLDARAAPKVLDRWDANLGGGIPGITSWKAVYSLDGDTLTICTGVGEGWERPADLNGGDSSHHVQVFRRVKD